MSEIWITAWVISLLSAAGALFCGWRAGLSWAELLLFASIFFPAPLFVALGGSNSFVYAFDLVVPLAIGLAAWRWRAVPLTVKWVASWLLLGVGMVPLLVVYFLADREHLLYAGISLYRLAGAMAVMCLMARAADAWKERTAGMLGAVGWMNVVLVAATLLQSRGWINSNVFYSVANEASMDDNDSMRYITAGLFRGSLGIIGTLGWVTFLAQSQARGWRALRATMGGGAGGLLIVLCGSKTSLLAAMVTTLAGCVVFPGLFLRLWKRLAVVVAGLAILAGVFLYQQDVNYFNYTLGVLGLEDQSLDTFAYRQERWHEAMDLLEQEPKILMGVATPFGPERGMAYFHNEYIGLLMGGGCWSAGAYLMGLLILGASLFRRRREADVARLFGGLTFLASAIQGASVNHMAPGIYFGCTVLMTACAYGVGLAPDPGEEWVEDECEAGAEAAEGEPRDESAPELAPGRLHSRAQTNVRDF